MCQCDNSREEHGLKLQLDLSLWASLATQLVQNLPEMYETLVRFLSREDPLEKG